LKRTNPICIRKGHHRKRATKIITRKSRVCRETSRAVGGENAYQEWRKKSPAKGKKKTDTRPKKREAR